MPADPRDHFSADEAGPKSDATPMELADDSRKGQPVRNQDNAGAASPFGRGMAGAAFLQQLRTREVVGMTVHPS